jgi:hypothetical protein
MPAQPVDLCNAAGVWEWSRNLAGAMTEKAARMRDLLEKLGAASKKSGPPGAFRKAGTHPLTSWKNFEPAIP